MAEKRSLKQNNSAHLWFKYLADTFNEHGLDMKLVLEKRHEIWWTPEAMKAVMFKGVMKAMYPGKESTAELTKRQFANVTNSLRDLVARDYGLDIEVPSVETQEQKYREYR